jgi:fumarylacetoacetase
MNSWLPIAPTSDFSLQNLPYGVFSTDTDPVHRIGVAVGDHVLDLKCLSESGGFSGHVDFDTSTLGLATLNKFAGLGRPIHKQVRQFLQEVLCERTKVPSVLRDNVEQRRRCIVPLNMVQLHLPMNIGDYTDFSVGTYHVQNVSSAISCKSRLMQMKKCIDIMKLTGVSTNIQHLPIAYHGRASSIVVSGTPIRRPKGQILKEGKPVHAPSQLLDFEVEFAAFIGRGNDMGQSISIEEAEEHIFGVVLMNDWSARDVQGWESAPLGPFNSKNFGTTVSPWIVTLDALETSRAEGLSSVAIESISRGPAY